MTTSVLCPTFRRGAALARTLESVLGQSDVDLELLVGDDGSGDDTVDVARDMGALDPRLRVFRLDHTGHPGLVRQFLAGEARGDIVAYIDHDDLWDAHHLDTCLAAMRDGGDVVVAGARYVSGDGSTVPVAGGHWDADVATLDPVAEPTRVVHRAGLLASCPWRAAPGGLEDWDLWWRMARGGVRFELLPTVTCEVWLSVLTRRHRLHDRLVLPLCEADTEAAAAVLAREADGAVRAALPHDLAAWRGEAVTDGTGEPPAWLVPHVLPGGRSGWLVAFVAPVVDPHHLRDLRTTMRRRLPLTLGAALSALENAGVTPFDHTNLIPART